MQPEYEFHGPDFRQWPKRYSFLFTRVSRVTGTDSAHTDDKLNASPQLNENADKLQQSAVSLYQRILDNWPRRTATEDSYAWRLGAEPVALRQLMSFEVLWIPRIRLMGYIGANIAAQANCTGFLSRRKPIFPRKRPYGAKLVL